MKDENKFWRWFKENCVRISTLNTLNEADFEEMMDELLLHLQEYSKGLYFLIEPDDRKIIITADGVEEYFEDVENLVNAAPRISDWKVIAFKPASKDEFITESEGVLLSTNKMWFIPLKNQFMPKKIGLRIYLSNYQESKNEQYFFAAWELLDSLLGEKICSSCVEHVELEKLPCNPDELGLIKLQALPKYISDFSVGLN